MATQDADASARVLAGRYRLGPTLGTGANAKSFDATDLTDGTPVVVKMLPSQFGASASFMQRFNENLTLAASLDHPNIARIKDFGVERANGRTYPFVVTEQFAGGSLRGILDRGRTLTASQVLLVGLDVCRGLAYAHARGLVHGSITPSNLLFGLDRRVHIADFGIAKLLGDIAWSDPSRADIDTARYASPEHALGLPTDPRSDIYSLCLTLAESVTGQVPFAADTAVATLSARVDRLMPVSADLGALASVLERAGRPQAEDRFTAVELGKALVAAAEKMPRPEPIPVVGLGRFGETTAALPVLDPSSVGPDDVVEGVPDNVTSPGEADVDALSLLAALPDSTDHLIADPLPAIQSMPHPALLEPAAPAQSVDPSSWDAVDDREVGAPSGAFDDPAVTPPSGVALDASGVIGEVATDWQPEPGAGRRTATIETVEGDDDVLNIDRRSFVSYLLVALALVAAAVVGVIGYRALSTPSREVPNLIGTPEAQAANIVADNGWQIEVRRERDDTQPQGSVTRTDPAAGDRLRKGGTLVVVVSDGPTLSKLPKLEGLSVDAARSALTAVGLLMRESARVDSDTVPAGQVISWSVPAQEGLAVGSQVPKGTTVEVVVSAGPSARSVPILIGRTLEEARTQLEPLGFVVGTITEVFSEAGAAGEILATDPEAETRAESGTAVNLTISKGPDLVLVPDLIGKTFAEAKELLTKNGLQLGSTTGSKTGVVAGADIPAGTQVRRGTQISVIFGTA